MALTQLKTSGIADDAVTTDKLANAINTERTANTAKSTNATHTGEVTGSGALTITADAVTGAKIADDAVGAEHIEQLDADLSFADSAKAKFGAGNDLEIHHTSNDNIINSATTNLYIQRNGTTSLAFDGNGDLNIPDSKVLGFGNSADYQLSFDGSTVIHSAANNNISIRAKTGENAILMQPDSSVSLYYDDVKQCETAADGLAFPSGKGINFNATADASGTGITAGSELLDDYEEGTWTPTDGSGASISFTLSSTCVYTKIGRMVYLQFDVYYASNSSSSDASLSGLPFSQAQQYGSGVIGWTDKDSANGIVCHIDNSNRVQLMDNSGASSSGGKHLRNDELSGVRFIGIATYVSS